jgi:parallel beta-helix repeat protein
MVVISIVVIFVAGCKRESLMPKSTETNVNELFGTNPGSFDERYMKEFSQKMASEKERLTKTGANKSCVNTVFVPRDFSSIQEAVNSVCDYGQVIVHEGTYSETVTIYKPGVRLKAIGSVLVIGAFGIVADDVSIQNFTIDATYTAATIYPVGIGSSSEQFRVEVKQNTIIGSNHIGIYFNYGKDIKVEKNHILGDMDYGILFDAVPTGGFTSTFTEDLSRDNIIMGNTVEGVRAGFGYGAGDAIWVRRKSVNNKISGNTVSDCIGGIILEGESSRDNLIAHNTISGIGPNAAGIELIADCDQNLIEGNRISNSFRGIFVMNNSPSYLPYGSPGSWSCDYNTFKNNTITNSTQTGLGFVNGGSNNTIGPGNVFNGNYYGIALVNANSNYIFNNKAFDNLVCDIRNFFGTNNTLKNNKADCIDGF